jgi:signal peptidase II
MTGYKRALLVLFIVLTCVGCDQASKSYASRALVGGKDVALLGETFRLQYTENPGAMLGVGSELPGNVRFWIFVVFAGCALVAILIYTILGKNLRAIDVLSFSLILGGGAGNLIDRLFKGGVVIDFMILTLGFLKTAIFNIADTAVICGLMLLAISNLPWFSGSAKDEIRS